LDAYITKNNNNSVISQPQPKQVYTKTIVQNQPQQQFQCQNKSYKVNNSLSISNKKKKEIVFNVKPDIQNDIYNLYCIEHNEEIFYNIAYIPDYKTSVMMNKLFRNIKENDNLDLLEESDDEEEFQNENIDRFVDVNKSHLMICKFNHKFKKWYPVKDFSNQNPLIVEKKDLGDCEKNNYGQYHNKNYNNTNTNFQNKKYNTAPRQYQHQNQYQNQNKRPFHAQNRNQKPNYVKVK
jgi:hypothetical protein